MVDRENLSQFSSWTGFVGIISIILGIISAISGLFVFVVGAIPGIITIILGVKLRNAKKYADEVIAAGQDDGKLNLLFMNLNTYFKIQGILIIIFLIMIIIGMFTGLFAGLTFFHALS